MIEEEEGEGDRVKRLLDVEEVVWEEIKQGGAFWIERVGENGGLMLFAE